MKIPIRCSFFSIVAVVLFGVAGARADWLDDYNKAVAEATVGHKSILMNFTGSDWCPWCIRMDKEVLDTDAFKAYAGKNLVLLTVDFPQTKQLAQSVQDQNNNLQKKYDVQGFPTFILVDKDGNVLGQQVGYLEGGPSAFIAKLDSMKK